MFQFVDTILAFAAVMLILSLLITVTVQAVVSLTGLRGLNLIWAVTEILKRADEKDANDPKRRAKNLLNDPILAPSGNIFMRVFNAVRKQLGSVDEWKRPPTEISKEDLILLLKHSKKTIDEEAIGRWYDVAMTSAKSRYKLRSRWITVLGAFVLAFLFQVNSLDILDKLQNDKARALVIAQIPNINALYEEDAEKAAVKVRIDSVLAAVDSKVIQFDFMTLWPLNGENLEKAWGEARNEFPGKMMTLLLLSLGAPFWYGAIGSLVGFRSSLKPKQPEDTKPKKSGNEEGDG